MLFSCSELFLVNRTNSVVNASSFAPQPLLAKRNSVLVMTVLILAYPLTECIPNVNILLH